MEPQVFGDERGFFYESFNQHRFVSQTGLRFDFVQDNHSRSQQRAMLISGVWREKKEGRILLDRANHQTRNTP
jgi:dTDP-4-dehydrorhamnose 3,5-epimerase-like enzyme